MQKKDLYIAKSMEELEPLYGLEPGIARKPTLQ